MSSSREAVTYGIRWTLILLVVPALILMLVASLTGCQFTGWTLGAGRNLRDQDRGPDSTSAYVELHFAPEEAEPPRSLPPERIVFVEPQGPPLPPGPPSDRSVYIPAVEAPEPPQGPSEPAQSTLHIPDPQEPSADVQAFLSAWEATLGVVALVLAGSAGAYRYRSGRWVPKLGRATSKRRPPRKKPS